MNHTNERKLVGYAVKLFCKGSPLSEVMWVSKNGGSVSLKSLRRVFVEYYDALRAMPGALVGSPASGKGSVRIVAIYRKPKRTAEQEHADVVAWVGSRPAWTSANTIFLGLKERKYIGAAQ